MERNSDLENLKEWISYNPLTGLFRYIKSPNRRKPIGSFAGSKNKKGYITIHAGGKTYQAARAAYLMHHGCIPKIFIDHKDGNPSNNTISNLRPATRQENGANSKTQARNKTGVKGVYLDKRVNKYVARVRLNGVQIYIGQYTELEEAHIAVQEARNKLHGNFANHGQ